MACRYHQAKATQSLSGEIRSVQDFLPTSWLPETSAFNESGPQTTWKTWRRFCSHILILWSLVNIYGWYIVNDGSYRVNIYLMMVNICSSSFPSSYCRSSLFTAKYPQKSSSVSPWSHNVPHLGRQTRQSPQERLCSSHDPAVVVADAWNIRGDRGRDRNGYIRVLIGLQTVGISPRKMGSGGPLQHLKLFFLCIHFWGCFAGELRCEKTVLNVDVADHHVLDESFYVLLHFFWGITLL